MDFVQSVTETSDASRVAAADRGLERLLGSQPAFALDATGSTDRPALEAYVAGEFARAYDARIDEFLPHLFSMHCGCSYSAVAGLRPADSGRLFVEQYLDVPVEEALAALAGRPVERNEIIEVGNLVATRRGASRLFFTLLVSIVHDAGFRWGVFSATSAVARILNKLNFVATPIAAADPGRLSGDVAKWGRYYDTRPVVLAVDVEATLARLNDSLLAGAAIRFFAEATATMARRLRLRLFR